MAFENLKSTGIKYVLTKLKDYFLQIKDAVKSVNGETADENGDIHILSVPYAQNLQSELAQRNSGTFINRMSGGTASIEDGEGWLMSVKGDSIHTGFTPESISHQITSSATEPIDIDIDRDTFVDYVADSGTIVLTYSGSAWSADLEDYGITVTGTPLAGDIITITYVKEVPGTITVCDPETFVSTGWNLYDHSAGYARVVKYDQGYMISGTYTTAKFALTPTGTQMDLDISGGAFDIPADGYVIVTGGNSTDTAIFPVHEDWDSGYEGEFEAYTQSVIDLSGVMAEYFPNGLFKAGASRDEINLNIGQAIQRVERMLNTDENMATAKASGREYEYDSNYIYLALASAESHAISLSCSVTANDHGIEYFTGTSAPAYAELLYGNNLKNKLERNVVTISPQELNATDQAQVRTNIGAVGHSEVVHTTGNETIDGTKVFTASPYVNTGTRYKYLNYAHNANETTGLSGRLAFDAGSDFNQSTNKFYVLEYSPKATATTTNTGYYEQYMLPAPDKGLSANKSYDILTTKDDFVRGATSSGITLNLSEAGRYMLFFCGAGTTRCGMYAIVSRGSSTNAEVYTLNEASAVTITPGKNKIVVSVSVALTYGLLRLQ